MAEITKLCLTILFQYVELSAATSKTKKRDMIHFYKTQKESTTTQTIAGDFEEALKEYINHNERQAAPIYFMETLINIQNLKE